METVRYRLLILNGFSFLVLIVQYNNVLKSSIMRMKIIVYFFSLINHCVKAHLSMDKIMSYRLIEILRHPVCNSTTHVDGTCVRFNLNVINCTD